MFEDLFYETLKAEGESPFNESTEESDALCQPKTHQSSKRNFSCDYPDCQKIFLYKSELNRHMQSHANSRPYVCPFDGCEKGFKRLDTLQTHFRIHTGEKPFVCNHQLCGMSFATQSALRYHLLKHSNNKMFKCGAPTCEKSFLTLGQLRQHEKGKCSTRSYLLKDNHSTGFLPKELLSEQIPNALTEPSSDYAHSASIMRAENSMMYESVIIKKLKKLLE